MRMLRDWGLHKFVWGLSGLLLIAQAAQAVEPLVVVRIAPLRECQADMKAVQEVLGTQQDGVTQAMAWLLERTETLTKNGLDDSRPLGMAAVSAGGDRVVWVAAVPTTDVHALHDVVKPWIGDVEEKEDGVVKFTFLGKELYANAVAGWVYVSEKQAAVSHVPSSPEPWLEGFDLQWDVGVRVNVPQVLASFGPRLGAWVEKVKERTQREAERHPLAATLIPQILSVASAATAQTQEWVVGWQVDRESQKVRCVCRCLAIPNTNLARYFAEQQNVTSPLVALRHWPDAAFSAGWVYTFPTPPEEELEKLGQALRAEMEQVIERRISKTEDANLVRELFEEWLGIANDWVHHGRYEGAVTLVAKPDQVTLVAAKFVGNSDATEKFVGHLVESAQAKFPKLFERVTVTPDYARHGDAVIHRMEINLGDKLTAAQKAVLGEKLEVAFTAVNGYAGVAIGKNAVATLKRAIDDCVAQGEQAAPSFEMRASIEKMTDVCAQLNPKNKRVQEIKEYLHQNDREELVTARATADGRSAEVVWEADLRLMRVSRMVRHPGPTVTHNLHP
ncbi:hypothetical protein [Thermogutta sp.]|uniref:hypothetical protein n=1 Tax=Thermogutta sp. TaxID=1962930 RepID=UPI00322036C7